MAKHQRCKVDDTSGPFTVGEVEAAFVLGWVLAQEKVLSVSQAARILQSGSMHTREWESLDASGRRYYVRRVHTLLAVAARRLPICDRAVVEGERVVAGWVTSDVDPGDKRLE